MEAIGLYVHFPFCRRKCSYCHFYSLPDDKRLFERWLKNLRREADLYSGKNLRADTLYIGGGTPSLLESEALFRVLEALGAELRENLVEMTLEANPDIPDEGVIRGWKETGVDRLSIGIQSFDDRILRILGRNYTARQAENFISLARRAGFTNIGLDLMIGVPGETGASLRKNLQGIRRVKPEHVSLYILENIEGLPFESVVRGRPPDEDAGAEAYEILSSGLEEAGLARYEISNFSRHGKECRHNLKYWRYESFLGLGPSACSHSGAMRWSNIRDLEGWASALESGEDGRREVKFLDSGQSLKEALVFGLRLTSGINLKQLKDRFGVDVLVTYESEIHELADQGLILVEGDRLRIPADKFLISNAILSKFI